MYYIILFDFFYYYFPNYKTARAFFKYNRRFRGDYISCICLCIDFDILTAKKTWWAALLRPLEGKVLFIRLPSF